MLFGLFVFILIVMILLFLAAACRQPVVRTLPEGLREFDKPQYCDDGACDESAEGAEYRDDTAAFDVEKFIPSPIYTGFR
ncbi:hypothetical protein BNJ_00387 [Kaumoebavirus]|uniref:hypothetical protein n=1 Tax=Kaumoebavirus TaxID=1859492 RepID=UPI0009C1B440|nr:hypothetical protein BNJ_00387 [Kaumoebavirus]ARA72206.1 hypothetical protein BNJ_00387 [Kaumoebavirus]